MGKVTAFNFMFANERGVFYSGSLVQGHVELELEEPMLMKGIKLRILGRGFAVGKYQIEVSPNEFDLKPYESRGTQSETYINTEIILHGAGQGNTELPQGRHHIPFEFQLPLGLPSTFYGVYGYVKYLLTCRVDRAWRSNPKVKKAFSVISVLDLNAQPDWRKRQQDQREQIAGCCTEGNISATFRLERKGFVPGEAVIPIAEINNGTNKRLAMSAVVLKMHVHFSARGWEQHKTTELARVQRPAIEPHSTDSWTGQERLVIPPLPPSFLEGCNIMNLCYTLDLIVDPRVAGKKFKIPLDIIVGTVPLVGVAQ